MNWRFKFRMLTSRGATPEAAMEQLLDERDSQIQDMDRKLAKCIDYLSEKQFKEIFDKEYRGGELPMG